MQDRTHDDLAVSQVQEDYFTPAGQLNVLRAANKTSTQAACMHAASEQRAQSTKGWCGKQHRCQGCLCSSNNHTGNARSFRWNRQLIIQQSRAADAWCLRAPKFRKFQAAETSGTQSMPDQGMRPAHRRCAVRQDHHASGQASLSGLRLTALRAGVPGRAAGPPSTCRPPSRRSARSAVHPACSLDQGLAVTKGLGTTLRNSGLPPVTIS